MIQNLFGKCKDIFIKTVNKLNSADKRIVLAELSKIKRKGGQSFIAKEFGVSRDTIRKGTVELESGIKIVDKFSERGRKAIEEYLPNLLDDIRDIVDPQSQTDPSFKTTRLYTRLSVKEIRKQLIIQKNYRNEELPINQTLNNKINRLGYTLKRGTATIHVKNSHKTVITRIFAVSPLACFEIIELYYSIE